MKGRKEDRVGNKERKKERRKERKNERKGKGGNKIDSVYRVMMPHHLSVFVGVHHCLHMTAHKYTQ